MGISKNVVWLFFIVVLLIPACNSDPNPASTTIVPTIHVTETRVTAENNLPPTHTPPASPTSLSAEMTNGLENLDAIDAILQDIDNDVCREAHEAYAEIQELLAQGQDVADLETAVIELINELDNCSLSVTPAP